MEKSKSVLLTFLVLFGSLSFKSCSEKSKESSNTEAPVIPKTKAHLENEAWHMEELYWEYVQKIDTVSYKALLDKDFIGYPSFGDGVSDKSKMASWIPDLHKNPNLKFSSILHKKASNAIDDVVIVFYDADEIWTNKQMKKPKKRHTSLPIPGKKWMACG